MPILAAIGASLVWSASAAPPVAAPPQSIERITVEQAAARIRQHTGRPTVIVFYKTTCPISQAMFPSLVALARRQQVSGVSFLVFAVDSEVRVNQIPRFLARYGAPFPPVFVQPWTPGTFSRTMATLGITAGATWTTPLVAVRASGGRIVTQGQGVRDVGGLDRALAAAR
jgi:thiol-disulfide isomerase/thioredoxin